MRLPSGRRPTGAFCNPVLARPGADHGDPFVLEHLGSYHLFHTAVQDVAGYTSEDLVDWRAAGGVLDAYRPDWAQVEFWAPEVEYRHGTFLMYVAATRRGPDGRGDDQARRLGLARSSDPLGPYRLDEKPLLEGVWAIDGHPFTGGDGRHWLFFNLRDDTSGPRGAGGTRTAVVALGPEGRPTGRVIPVACPSERWEGDRNGDFYWNEAPWALERGGRVHATYSGGFYGDDSYAIGLVSAPDPAGPWTKEPDNPMLVSGRRLRGPGHNCVIRAPDGVTPYAVYHAHLASSPQRSVQLDRLDWVGGRPRIAAREDCWPAVPTEGRQPLPPRAAYDPSVAHWCANGWAAAEVEVAGEPIELPAEPGLRRVTACGGPGGWLAWADGQLLHSAVGRAAGPPGLAGAGVQARSLVSHREDAGPHRLVPGAQRRWAWGGKGLCELCLSLRGEAVLSAGSVIRRLRWPDAFGFVRMHAEDVGQLTIRAGSDGAVVADVVLTARSGSAGGQQPA